jgi:uncharacterized delta-60 repeat protein
LQDFGDTQNRPSAKVSALQTDGKILVGGNFTVASGLSRSGIARFNPDGTPDATFDAGDIGTAEGALTIQTGGTIYAIKVQTDGKILIGGNYKRGNETTARSLERLNADGSIDSSFQSAISGNFSTVRDIEVQTDGKVVVGGTFQITAVNPSNGQSVTFKNLARLNADGTFDFTFVAGAPENSNEIVIQTDGKIVAGNASVTAVPNQLIRYAANGSTDAVLAEFDDWILGLELVSDGKFVVVGSFNYVNDTFLRRVARLNANGSIDASFTSGSGFMNGLFVNDVAVQTDGKLVIGGDFQIFNDATRWRVARLNQDGSIDASFNTSTPIAGNVSDVLILPGGKIFFAGAFPLPTNTEFYNNIGRMNADGSIDTNFNNANVIFEGEGYTIVQQPDGKILVGGFFFYANNLRRRGIARYNADGTIDTGFVPFPNLANVQDIALQADGKILVVSSDSPSTLYRLNADGSQDTSFNAPFVPFSASIQQRTRITTIAVLAGGKILVAGQLITGSATSPTLSGLIRLNADGSRDTSFALVGAQGGVKDVHDFAVQTDGKIVIGGDFTHINNNFNFHHLARINPDGSIDTSFPSPPVSGFVNELELQWDGKVVFNDSATIKRYIPGVGLDPGFNVSIDNNGIPTNVLEAMLVLPNDKILIGGSFVSVNGVPRARIARLNANGTVDTFFDIPGGANNIVYDFSLQTDGKILVAGAFTKLGGVSRIGAARLIQSNAQTPLFDFDGDGKSDMAVYRGGEWHLLQTSGGYAVASFGLADDKLTPADYDGDGRADLAVYRDGTWYLQRSALGFGAIQFGLAGDIPQPLDFTGDGRAEIAVYRPSTGVWYIYNIVTKQTSIVQFGLSEDKPVAADFTGDGRAEIAVWRPSTGDWYHLNLTNNEFGVIHFGQTGDIPAPGDYDGDGKTDFAVFREGVWYLQQSTAGFGAVQFGLAGDIPTAADFDGDGKTNISVYRSGVWYYLNAANGAIIQQFGLSGDVPVESAFNP